MALSPDHTQLIHQLQSTSTLHKRRTHHPKCISPRDGIHGTERQLQGMLQSRDSTPARPGM